ncbi:MAG TPA: hypothetical protein VNC50_00480 [Planctomycetia bacterium]|nr:hypothetical protein [Planctomycetia bacterium]
MHGQGPGGIHLGNDLREPLRVFLGGDHGLRIRSAGPLHATGFSGFIGR